MSIENRNCKFCHSDISTNAKVCNKCGQFQSWPSHLPFSPPFLAFLIAFIAVFTWSAETISTLITPDNSQVSVRYINRADTTIPIVTSNKGSRPAIMNSIAGLEVEVFDKKTGEMVKYLFTAHATDSTRENLLIPENTSKQFFFALDVKQPARMEHTFQSFLKNANIININKCTFHASYIDFNGTERSSILIIYEKSADMNKLTKLTSEELLTHEAGSDLLENWLSASECYGKVPLPVRQRHKASSD